MDLPPKTTTPYFPNLDGLRWIAFLMVFADHAYVHFFKDITPVRPIEVILTNGFFNQGFQGVSLFYVLSGFLITNIILQERYKTGRFDLLKFYFRRALRIWPIYFLVLTIIFLCLQTALHVSEQPSYYLLFISNFYIVGRFHHNLLSSDALTVTWSLSVEEQFYAFWPLLFLIVPKRFFILLFMIFIGGALVFRIFHSGDYWSLQLNTLSVFSDLALGGLGAYLSLRSLKFTQLMTGLSSKWLMSIYGVYLLALFLNATYHFDMVTRIIFPFFYVFIILEQNLATNSIFKMKNIKVFSTLGKYTYSFYLIHMIPILLLTSLFLTENELNESIIMRFILTFSALAVTIILGYLSYTFYEMRFLKLKDQYSKFRKLFI